MRHFLFALCFLLGVGCLCSCKKTTSSICSLLLTADSLMWAKPDTALLLLEQVATPQKLRGADRALYALLMTQARYKSCKLLGNDSLIKIAVDYYEGTKDWEKLAKAHFYWGCIYMEQQELPKAIELYLKAIDVMPQGMDSIFLAMVYSHLGDCYNRQDLTTIAREMYKKCYVLCERNDTVRSCYALNNIGDTFFFDSQADSAFIYYQKSLDMATSFQDADLLSVVYNDLAGFYNEQSRYSEAEFYISKALACFSDKEDYTLACSTKGDILNNLGQKDSAVYYWNIGKESSNIYCKTSSYYSLYQENKRKNDWKAAVAVVDSFIVFYDSIQGMNVRAELDKLMDNHLVKLYKDKLTAKNQKILALVTIFFLLFISTLIILYLWRDRCQKKRYVVLQQRLMKNRAEMILLNELSEVTLSVKGIELYKLEEERFEICNALFKTTDGYKMLNELMKVTPKVRINKANVNRQIIVNDIIKTFADIMGDLKERCSVLTSDDLLYCILSLLRCPKDILLVLMDVSADAIKTRKNRIKHKIDIELFNRIFNY